MNSEATSEHFCSKRFSLFRTEFVQGLHLRDCLRGEGSIQDLFDFRDPTRASRKHKLYSLTPAQLCEQLHEFLHSLGTMSVIHDDDNRSPGEFLVRVCIPERKFFEKDHLVVRY